MSHTTPSVVFHLDNMRDGEWWIILNAYDWAELLKKNQTPTMENPDKQTSWHIRNLIQAAKEVLKDLE